MERNKYIRRIEDAIANGDTKEAIKQMWLIGMSINEIAEQLSMNSQEVFKIFMDNNFIYS